MGDIFHLDIPSHSLSNVAKNNATKIVNNKPMYQLDADAPVVHKHTSRRTH